jgi:hypothetical protein
MNRGTHIHKITELFDLALLGPFDTEGEDEAFLGAYQKFKQDKCFMPLVVEARMYHPALLYAGAIDRIGQIEVDGKKQIAVVDIKTGAPHHATNVQLSAYAEMAKANGHKVDASYALHLSESGSYRLIANDSHEYSFRVFRAALIINQWRETVGK